jgi:hypothetical protein
LRRGEGAEDPAAAAIGPACQTREANQPLVPIGGTGIALYKNWLYAEVNDRIVRYDLKEGETAPAGQAETILSGMPITGDHPMHPFAIDAQGNLFVAMGSATNACEVKNRMPHSPGNEPCTEYHANMFIPLKGARQIGLVVAPPANRADKYMLAHDIARYVRRIGADGLLDIGEAWIARFDDIPHGGYPDQAANRFEALTMTAANAKGQLLSLSATIHRKLIKKHKVKHLGPTEIEEGERVISMAPVLEVWGKLGVLRLHEKTEWDDWLKDHYGHTSEAEEAP